MNLKNLIIFTIAVATLTTAGCASAESKHPNRIKHSDAVISFDPASFELRDAHRTELKRMLRDARSKGVVKEITVAAWSDKALPRQGQDQSDADRKLAESRAEAIQSYLKSIDENVSIDAYNMAESANWLARTFNTREAELKSIFGKTGGEVSLSREEFNVFKKKGGPSTAVVVTKYKDVD